MKVSYEKFTQEAQYTDFSGAVKTVKKYTDMPTFDYVSGYNFFPYYHTSDLQKAVFISERLLMSYEAIAKIARRHGFSINKEEIDKEYQYVDDKDYNAIKNGIPFYGYNMGEHGDTRIDDRYRITEKKKLYEVIELSTQTHTRWFINGKEY